MARPSGPRRMITTSPRLAPVRKPPASMIACNALMSPGATDLVPLRRFDIVYVPRTGLAGAGVFMQQIKDLIPGNAGFDYAVTNQAKIF